DVGHSEVPGRVDAGRRARGNRCAELDDGDGAVHGEGPRVGERHGVAVHGKAFHHVALRDVGDVVVARFHGRVVVLQEPQHDRVERVGRRVVQRHVLAAVQYGAVHVEACLDDVVDALLPVVRARGTGGIAGAGAVGALDLGAEGDGALD